MNLIDAIKLYTHILQEAGGGINGRDAARKALQQRAVSENIVEMISFAVSNDGHLVSGGGSTFALTQISSC